LRAGEHGAEPKPLGDDGQRCGEALRHQHGEPGAEKRQRGKDRKIAQAHADDAAEQEPVTTGAAEAAAEQVGIRAEHESGEEEAAEVGAGGADGAQAAIGEDR